MATLTKGEIVNQMYIMLRVSGLTVDPSPEHTSLALAILERMILSYENQGLFLAYNKSETYPDPDAGEESGLRDHDIHAVVLLLARNTAPAFGKMLPPQMQQEADQAYRGLFNTIPPVRAQNPYQPAGQGNSYYCSSDWYNSYMPTDDRLTVESNGQLENLTFDDISQDVFNSY